MGGGLHPPEVPLGLGNCLADSHAVGLVKPLLFSRLSAFVVGAAVLTLGGGIVDEIIAVVGSRGHGPAGENAASSATAAAFGFSVSFLSFGLVLDFGLADALASFALAFPPPLPPLPFLVSWGHALARCPYCRHDQHWIEAIPWTGVVKLER